MNQVREFNEELVTARQTASDARGGVRTALVVLEAADAVVSILDAINNDAKTLRNIANGLEKAALLASKIGGVVGTLAKPIKRLIEKIEKRAKDIDDKIADDSAFLDGLSNSITVMTALLESSEVALTDVIDDIDATQAARDDAADAIDVMANLANPVDPLDPTYDLSAYDAAIANANASVGLSASQKATIDAATAAVETSRAAVATAVEALRGPVDKIVAVYDVIKEVTQSLNFLQQPMEAIAAVLQPIQWALDAIQIVYDTVISPIIDPILDALGINKLFEPLEDLLQSLLDQMPTLAFDDINVEFAKLDVDLDELTGIYHTFTNDIDTLVTDTIQNELLNLIDAARNARNGLVTGKDDGFFLAGTTVLGGAGAQVLSGGKGDDSLFGGTGDDVLIGGEGDDRIDGEAGTDAAVLLGDFEDFIFLAETNAANVVTSLTAVHNNVLRGEASQGTDVIVNVSDVILNDRVIAYQDFANFQYAGPGGDTLVGDVNGPANDYLFGEAGQDTLIGLNGDDYLSGRDEDDALRGGRNDDWLDGGPGNDIIDGGRGSNDTASYETDPTVPHYIDLGAPSARRPFTNTEDVVGIENLSGSSNTEWFWGNDGVNRIAGKGGDDKLNGFGGNDIISGGAGNDQIVGGRGNDLIYGGDGLDIFIGGLGNDTYVDTPGNRDILWYGGGANNIWTDPFTATPITAGGYAGLPTMGFVGSDRNTELPWRVEVDMTVGQVRKFASNGTLTGTDTLDGIGRVMGTRQNDTLTGSAEAETLEGGAGADVFNGGGTRSDGSQDILNGGRGNDFFDSDKGGVKIDGGAGRDRIIIDDDGSGILENGFRALSLEVEGGSGYDTLDLSNSNREWDINPRYGLPGEANAAGHIIGFRANNTSNNFGDNELLKIGGIEKVIASDFWDSIFAFGDIVEVYGGAGRDLITLSALGGEAYGGTERDTLRGTIGDDLLSGGEGADILQGTDGFSLAGGGNDRWFGGTGNDELTPYRSAAGQPAAVYTIDGGTGNDVFNISGLPDYRAGFLADLNVSLLGGRTTGDGYDITLTGVENLRGSNLSNGSINQGPLHLGNDTLTGNNAGNRITGETGNDILFGLGGNDVLHGNRGNDSLDGGTGSDLLFGAQGNNLLDGGNGTDTASWDWEMNGDDWNGSPFGWSPSTVAGFVKADLLSARAEFTAYGRNGAPDDVGLSQLANIENLQGSWDSDVLRGDDGDNTISGGRERTDFQTGLDIPADDYLEGRGGNDVLSGGGGNDIIYGDSAIADKFGLIYLNGGTATGDRIQVNPAVMPGGSLTIEMMLQATDPAGPNGPYFLSYAVPGSDNEILFEIFGGNLRIAFNNTAFDTNISAERLIDGAMHRLSVSMDVATDEVKIYIDGLQAGPTIINPTQARALTSGGSFVIGQEQDGVNSGYRSDQIFKGGVGDIRLFDHVRSAEEIQENWDSEIGNPAAVSGLIANWQVEEGTTEIADKTGGSALQIIGATPAIRSTGRAGADTLKGGTGDDILIGGRAGDDLDGEEGNDAVFYSDAWEGVTVNLVTGAADGGTANGDTLTSIENISGSRYDDHITASSAANLIVGDAGFDTVSYQSSTRGSRIDLVTGSRRGDARDDVFQGIEAFEGSDFDDQFRGDARADTLFGMAGDDTLHGRDDDDALHGGSDNDALYGQNGDDMLSGDQGADLLDGGSGFDTASYQSATRGVRLDLVTGSQRGDARGDTYRSIEVFEGSDYDDQIRGGASAEILLGMAGDDLLQGRQGNDRMVGGTGNDELTGQDGDDMLFGESGGDLLNGGDGFDTASYQSATRGVLLDLVTGSQRGDARGDTFLSIEAFEGTDFDDEIRGDADAQTVSGMAGDDTLLGRGGNDSLLGGSGDDALSGQDGDDLLDGGIGADVLNGGRGFDMVSFQSSDRAVRVDLVTGSQRGDSRGDTYVGIEAFEGTEFGDQFRGDGESNVLFGMSGDDILSGRDGNDLLDGGRGADALEGGGGFDTVSYLSSTRGAHVDLVTGKRLGDARGDTYRDVEAFEGTNFDDLFRGDAGADVLYGMAGDDTLQGRGGDDRLRGGDGDDFLDAQSGEDLLEGGRGADLLEGGAGADIFVFRTGHGLDLIDDFAVGTDLIRLAGTGLSFGGLTITDGTVGAEVDYATGTVTLRGVAATDLGSDDFEFV